MEKENKTLVTENSTLVEKNTKLTERCDELTTEIEDKNETMTKIEEILKNGYRFWNKSKILDSLISLINLKS